MHQPPTIPEGDEENEGLEQVAEGTHFPHTGAQQQPPIHDTTTTATDLQPREDSGVDYEQTPTLENEIIAVSDNVTTDEDQQAEGEEPSSIEKPITEDEAEDGAQPASDAENEIQGQLDEEGTLAGIKEEEGANDESVAIFDAEKPLTEVIGSPIPPADDSLTATPHVVSTDEHIKPDEITFTSYDDQRRSAKSGRERSAKGQRETPQVDFEKLEQEEEHDIVHEEPEIRISREELLARYQAAEAERDRLKSINLALQQRLADYLHKRKGTDDLPAFNQGNERLMLEQQQRYQKYLSEIETLQDHIKHDQTDYESKRNNYEQQIQKKKEHVEQLKADYVKLVREIASKAVFARSGKSISNQEVENYLTLLREKEEELIKTRHENIRLKNQLKKRELQLKAKEELAEGLHMIDFEQLKIENQTYSEKIEERNEELMKLRKKISTTVQILSHIKEKLNFVNEQRIEAAEILATKEKEVKQKRDELSTIKRRRDHLRQDNQSLKQTSGLIGNEHLLRDYEERYDEIGKCTDKLENLKKRHAEITLMCKVLKKKISKV
ncbi:unnamed protein product [Rotaria sp. Silwood2]|nr:unnamed protein product [Rotaria sp. Silwood2]CAF2581778.1 unnamed protein product [Rotaria sp. Silwood2]CAF2840972.1 unnamed protein product [Rotaria sp. Silwood2]CAF3937912.1 unnamed protein product [Rotaria sp. Silwood2]CAF3953850.1 unnamed protein product [Rotaria sp. Silwood2]